MTWKTKYFDTCYPSACYRFHSWMLHDPLFYLNIFVKYIQNCLWRWWWWTITTVLILKSLLYVSCDESLKFSDENHVISVVKTHHDILLLLLWTNHTLFHHNCLHILFGPCLLSNAIMKENQQDLCWHEEEENLWPLLLLHCIKYFYYFHTF